jgi:hypothetical protein
MNCKPVPGKHPVFSRFGRVKDAKTSLGVALFEPSHANLTN